MLQPRPLGRSSSRIGKVARPVEGLGGGAAQNYFLTGDHDRLVRGAVAAHLNVEFQLGLRLDSLGGLVLGAQPKTTSSLAVARSGRR